MSEATEAKILENGGFVISETQRAKLYSLNAKLYVRIANKTWQLMNFLKKAFYSDDFTAYATWGLKGLISIDEMKAYVIYSSLSKSKSKSKSKSRLLNADALKGLEAIERHGNIIKEVKND